MTSTHWFWPTSNPTRILDILECDGGWHTTSSLTMRLDCPRNSTQQALRRLKNKHLVQGRPTGPPKYGPPGTGEYEWSLRD